MNIKTGFATGAIILITTLILVGGGFYFFQSSSDESSKDTTDTNLIIDDSVRTADGDDTSLTGNTDTSNNGGNAMNSSEYSGEIIAGTKALLINYNKSDYEAALESDKLVVLYFYANWCPICKSETKIALYPAFNELEQENVVGFRVNFNDDETEIHERDLAREFGVAYQHTKVFLRNGERILKSPETWTKGRYLEEIQKAN